MKKQDRHGVRTFNGLEQKYDFNSMKGAGAKESEQMRQMIQTLSQHIAETNGTITTLQEKVKSLEENAIDIDGIYPVGSVYASVADTDPANLFGGEWERFAKGQVLVGAGLVAEEFAVVSHATGPVQLSLDEDGLIASEVTDGANDIGYITCYMWKRIS